MAADRERNLPVNDLLRRVLRVVDDSVRLVSADIVRPETFDCCLTRLENLHRNLQRTQESIQQVNGDLYGQLRQYLTSIVAGIRQMKEDEQGEEPASYKASRSESTNGAPPYVIPRTQLAFLISCGFRIRRISELLGVSIKTVKRRMRQYELKIRECYSNISNEQLDELVKQAINGNRQIGSEAVRARLITTGEGVRVQRYRVRESMNRVDPVGNALRVGPTINRRTYSVAAPNSLWHVDENHKLIRWNIVIHGGIDGYSRLLLFLEASSNNRKETVLKKFLSAVSRYGLPSRIRVDNGGENNDMCHLMEHLRGADRGSALRGRSVHNQRIERAWVDVWNGASNLFYDILCFLEQRGSLDIDCNLHIWAAHYVFLPRLNRELERFKIQWNNHGLRTVQHQTPLQLFVGGALEHRHSSLIAVRDFFGDHQEESVETRAERLFGEAHNHETHADDIPCPLGEPALAELKQQINPLSRSDEMGMDIYFQVLNFVEDHL